jgi:small GTP-binding protein
MSKSKSYKLVLVGGPGVGKTCLVSRLVRNEFHDEFYTPTIGAAVHSTTLDVDGNPVVFELWDTSGKYPMFVPLFCQGASAVLVTFSLCEKNSFVQAQTMARNLIAEKGSDFCVVLCGLQADNEPNRAVTELDASLTVREGFYFEVSSKQGESVKDMFSLLARRLFYHQY